MWVFNFCFSVVMAFVGQRLSKDEKPSSTTGTLVVIISLMGLFMAIAMIAFAFYSWYSSSKVTSKYTIKKRVIIPTVDNELDDETEVIEPKPKIVRRKVTKVRNDTVDLEDL